LGWASLYANTQGSFNVALGQASLQNNTEGDNNVAVGASALNDNTTGDGNTAVGYYALFENQTGLSNTSVGGYALYNNTGNENVALGQRSGFALASGNDNVFIGSHACDDVTSANNFFCFGNSAGNIFTANTNSGHMTLGNGSGQITIKGDLYVTGTIYNSNGSISTSGQDTSADDTDEIKGSSDFVVHSPSNESSSKTEGNSDNYSVNQITNNDNAEKDQTLDEEKQEETLFSYQPPKEILDNKDIKQKALSGESFESIDFRLSSLDESIIGLNNQLDLLDGRVSSLERSFMEQIIAMEDGFAMSAALAARPTPRTSGWNMTYGMGSYASSNALSIGFIYVGEEHIFSIGYAEADGSGKSMFNIGGSMPLNNIFKKGSK
jgi:hypothetical protein